MVSGGSDRPGFGQSMYPDLEPWKESLRGFSFARKQAINDLGNTFLLIMFRLSRLVTLLTCISVLEERMSAFVIAAISDVCNRD